jgi:DsbC/DsbD-like thiol-disulfide interchange protein
MERWLIMRMRMGVIGLLMLGTSLARGASGNDLVQAKLLADTSAAAAGQPLRIGVLLKITPHWHIYWTNPGDAGMATSVDLQLPPGFTASAWQYPVPTRIEQPGGIVSFGYEDQVMFIATITPPANATLSDVTIAANVKWLVCEKVCLPGSAQLSLTLPTRKTAEPTREDLFKTWTAKMPVALSDSSDIASHSEKIVGNQLSIAVNWRNDVPTQFQWFPPAAPAVSFNEVRIQTNEKTTTITATLEFLSGQTSGALESVLGYTAANEPRGTIVPIDFSASAQR